MDGRNTEFSYLEYTPGIYIPDRSKTDVRYLDLVGRPPSTAPPFFRLMTSSPYVEEARLLEWNPAGSDHLTSLYHIQGDVDSVTDELGESEVIVDAKVSRMSDRRCYLLVVGRPSEADVFRSTMESVTRRGLVVATPVVYKEGQVHARVIGDAAELQAMVEAMPSGFDIDVQAIGTYPDAVADPATALSEQQRAAVEAALALGYYESPRSATHADIAERLGCAPHTATRHLQKAEAKLVRGAMTAPGEGDGF